MATGNDPNSISGDETQRGGNGEAHSISGDRTRRGDAASVPDSTDGSTLGPDGETILGRVDRYILKEKLGQGAFGAVYSATDTEAGVEVALKGIPPLVAHNPEEL